MASSSSSSSCKEQIKRGRRERIEREREPGTDFLKRLRRLVEWRRVVMKSRRETKRLVDWNGAAFSLCVFQLAAAADTAPRTESSTLIVDYFFFHFWRNVKKILKRRVRLHWSQSISSSPLLIEKRRKRIVTGHDSATVTRKVTLIVPSDLIVLLPVEVTEKDQDSLSKGSRLPSFMLHFNNITSFFFLSSPGKMFISTVQSSLIPPLFSLRPSPPLFEAPLS